MNVSELLAADQVPVSPACHALRQPIAEREEDVAQSIHKLDATIRALLVATPLSKPWQRQLVSLLSQADHHMQVLRLTIVMVRSPEEAMDAAKQLYATLRAMNAYITTTRADIGIKNTVHITHGLARTLVARFRA